MQLTRRQLSNTLAIVGTVFVLVITYAPMVFAGKTLSVEVSGIRSTQGAIHVMLYDSSTSFEAASDIAVARYVTRGAKAGDMRFQIRNLLPGRYAIFVHHDENANNSYDSSATYFEGYGYSRNVGVWTAPSFDAAAISMPNDIPLPSISLIYPE